MVDYTFRRSPSQPSRSGHPDSREAPGSRLPIELLLQIFVHIPLLDIIRCRTVCRQFRQIIDETPEMQYHVELRVLGYENNEASIVVGASVRLAMLEARQRWWKPSRDYSWDHGHLDWIHFNFITNQYYDNLWLRYHLDTSRLDIGTLGGIGVTWQTHFEACCIW
ncbi:hypothetical protein BDY19DRAFT_109087 [Irpex rosettiformis]|uniref:Uncharacterized protein n=1 Tax=Irpex rosettiformis TaxID=378272 RepID=A0ACB8U5D4_9APHY|nr:hypothetical protein BDY19DRAFT_109087 [Irpex rosettiformis]